MPLFQSHVGINLTETKLQFVEISYKNNSFYLENVDQLHFKEILDPSYNETKLISILQDSFNKITQKKAVTSRNISFCLPNNFFKIFEIPYDDSLTKKDLKEHFNWELSVLFPKYEQVKYFIQHIDVSKSNMRQEHNAIVLALDRKLVETIYKFCKNNNFELKFVDNAHLASNAFLHLQDTYSKDAITLSLYIDQKDSSIVAVKGVFPFFFKIFGNNGQYIFTEIEKVIKHLEKVGVLMDNVRQIFLFGQNITDEFTSRIGSLLGSRIQKINPFESLKVEEEMKNNHIYKTQFNSFTAATGIAIRIV